MNSDEFFFAIFGLDSVSKRKKNKDLIQNEIFGGVACNGFGALRRLGLEVRMFKFSTMFIRIPNVQFGT